MSERVKGRIVVHTRGFGFVQLDEEDTGVGSAFVAPPDLNPFLAGDLVSATLERGQHQRWRARDLRLEARDRDALYGEVVLHGGRPHLRVDRMVANTDWPLGGGLDLAPGTRVVGRAGEGVVEDVREVPPADASLERVVARFGIRRSYPGEVLAQAQSVRPPDPAGRRDLRDVVTVTIDAPQSRDLDDALSVFPATPDGAIRVLVSIADVDALVPEGSPADLEARRRGTSVYLAGEVLPMLPAELSENALSLLEGVDRPAMTAELRIDAEGEVTATDLYPSLIRSTRRLSYEGVARFLEDDEPGDYPEEIQEALRWLRTVSARLGAVRRARGGVTLLREEAKVRFDEATGEPTAIVARRDNTAHQLIERLMVAANEAVASWLVDRGLPGIFRVHPAPDGSQVERLEDSCRHLGFAAGLPHGEDAELTPRGLAAIEAQLAPEGGRTRSARASALDTVLRRVLGPATYTVETGLHFGLAAPLYLHFTSPIRRYADLAVHRVVKAHLRGERNLHARREALAETAAHVQERMRRAGKAEAERLRMVAAWHFQGRIGERFRGHVTAVKPFGLIVQLENTGVSGSIQAENLPGGPFEVGPARHRFVGSSRTFTVGEPLEVEVRGADDALGRIDLALVQGEATER
ncbi:MAG: RNB domain-containing ribonuclease [Myxococcota bacterium]